MEFTFVLPQFAESLLVQDYEHVAHGKKAKITPAMAKRLNWAYEVKISLQMIGAR